MADGVTKWDYMFYISRYLEFGKGFLNTTPDATTIWEKKYDDGTTDFGAILELGEQGWELVSTTPILRPEGVTARLVFVFKRPRIDRKSVIEFQNSISESGLSGIPLHLVAICQLPRYRGVILR